MKRWQDILTRRDFLNVSISSGLTILLANCSGLLRRPTSQSDNEFLKNYGPIDRTLSDSSTQFFYGDNNARPHGVLWNLPKYMEGKKQEGPTENANIVIIGGGMSGLFTAYQFKKFNPILIEQAPRLGGNAKGQSWNGIDYSIGAAYLDSPHEGQPMYQYFKELDLRDVLVERIDPDPVESNGKLYYKFWKGEAEPEAIDKYKKMSNFFTKLNKEEERAFPFIPSLDPDDLASVKYYDQWHLHGLLSKIAGGKLPPKLETALEHYCWSTYACSSQELSASAGLNFLAQEVAPILIGAGGNAKVGEKILEALVKEVPTTNFRCNSLAMHVDVKTDHVIVTYEDAKKKLRRIKTKTAVICCPKFVAKKIIPGLEEDRLAAINKLRYRSYMTANLLIKKKMERRSYDIFLTGKGKTNMGNVQAAQEKINATDFVMANFAQIDASANVLTFYRAFPFDGARSELYRPDSFSHYKKKFEEQIARDIIPLMGFEQKDIVDLRLALWGHALPLAEKGIYRSNTIPTLRKPFRNRLFFIEQDNWAYPSTQTGATDVALMRNDILKFLT
ncbi:MAG: hypothetical protein A4S09_02615 [Proteobacteria bacterium SG_bin7]|nr:MAG: hypothetical protein A4S09_02615 [Proteobacteria bacterium SG_bin7]